VAKPLRICQVSAAYYPYPSGLTEHVHFLSTALRGRGHHVEILTTSFGNDGPPVAGVTRFGRARLIPLNKSYGTVPFGWRMSGQVKRYLAANEFDVLHLHGTYPPDIAFWALRHARVPTVVTFHTVAFGDYRAGAAVLRVLMRRWNRKLGGRIAESEAALRFQSQFFPGEFRLIPPGVDVARFHPGVEPLPELASDGAPVVLFVGRLDARKGLPVLLGAFARVLAAGTRARLVVAGKGQMFEECRERAAELGIAGDVHFAGFVPAELLPRYYASADVYCSPALGGEAYGIVLLEAMAAGAPVIASDIPGYNEVVQDGVSGVLAAPGSEEALAAAIRDLLGDAERRQALSNAGRAQAESLSWARIAERVEDYYRTAIGRAAGQA
jgi:phosphatidyl-myo-inositol alpha-mannosyltransferase